METFKTYEDKIQQLEKDLYFYKKTSRDLKKKLKELVGETVRRQQVPSERKTFSVTCHADSIWCIWYLVTDLEFSLFQLM